MDRRSDHKHHGNTRIAFLKRAFLLAQCNVAGKKVAHWQPEPFMEKIRQQMIFEGGVQQQPMEGRIFPKGADQLPSHQAE